MRNRTEGDDDDWIANRQQTRIQLSKKLGGRMWTVEGKRRREREREREDLGCMIEMKGLR